MPYSVKEFYEKNVYPNCSHINLEYLRIFNVPECLWEKNILVIGCGTMEANVIANRNRASNVVGIDIAKSQIAIAKSIKRHYNIKNVDYYETDILNIDSNSIDSKFDYIVANGVIHHIENCLDEVFIKIKSISHENTLFTGMVYNEKYRPKHIYELNQYFINNNFNHNDVINFFDTCGMEYSEEYNWFNTHEKTKEEITDTWLHPYFKQYTAESLLNLMENYFVNISLDYNEYDMSKLVFNANPRMDI